MTDSPPTILESSPAKKVTTPPRLANPSDHRKKEEETDVAEIVPYIVKTPRANSKLILQNMEEVLNSVKKKHRQKHRRKREQKKLEALQAANGEQREERKRHHKKPLQEKTSAQENGVSRSRVKHKHRQSPAPPPTDGTSCQNTPHKQGGVVAGTPKAPNAFEVLMNARNKSLGTNPSGQEAPLAAAAVEESPAKGPGRRKLLLQAWAERRGGAKRQRDEEARGAFVDQQLENRAKRFKEMLTNGTSSKDRAEEEEKEKEPKTTAAARKKSPARPGRKKGRVRARRLSSQEAPVVEVPAPETVEFLAKLSSPTKKRDSLLGYFPKKESPSSVPPAKRTDDSPGEAAKPPPAEEPTAKATPKKRVRRSAAQLLITPTVEAEVSAGTESPRPRRSCVGKARYDFDLDESPTKVSSPRGRPKAAPPKEEVVVAEESEIIDLDESNGGATPEKTTPLKLAPLFVRSVPKPSPDPQILKARQDFLRSGVPEKVRLDMERQKNFELSCEAALELFPRVAHVAQLSSAEAEFLESARQERPVRWRQRAEEPPEAASPAGGRKAKGKTRASQRPSGKDDNRNGEPLNELMACASRCALLPQLENKRDIVKTWKTAFERFPTYKCYNQMREKYRFFSAVDATQNTVQVSESLVVTRRRAQRLRSAEEAGAEEAAPPSTAPNGELLFTVKYRPMQIDQVLVNLTPVTQLRDFLANWSTSGGTNSQSMDASLDCANDSNSFQSSSNSVVLLGPTASGKTSAVYALAEEMNFNVLEINAGMKRTGKKLIQELQEATQSHQIGNEAQKHLLKRSLNGLKGKRPLASNHDQDSSSSSEPIVAGARKCLILIEDADIVFEQTDAGFTDAIYTLAASSKRPVIVVAADPNCAHLQRLINQNAIRFSPPPVLNISKFLAVLSLIENCPVALDDLISLYLYNRKDLRRTLHELQFFVQSGGDYRRADQAPPSSADAAGDEDQPFFASPSKRRFSDDPGQRDNEDEALDRNGQRRGGGRRRDAGSPHYTHRTLFEFYTLGQNEKWRIPFPVDFRLLGSNLADIFAVSAKLAAVAPAKPATPPNTKRRTRSPKKAWLSSVKAAATPLESLCAFYENASVAVWMGGRRNAESADGLDRLVPHPAENVAHELIERSIDVCLGAGVCPYNLFETPRDAQALADQIGSTTLRSCRVRALDVEPTLRAICRSERQRATVERRSSRFYHYLRNSGAYFSSFSTERFDAAADVLVDAAPPIAHEEESSDDTPRAHPKEEKEEASGKKKSVA